MTPMIDMTFQLIAFFMFVVNFSEAEQDDRQSESKIFARKRIGGRGRRAGPGARGPEARRRRVGGDGGRGSPRRLDRRTVRSVVHRWSPGAR